MENLIQKYLKKNNVEGKNGIDYRLEDAGNGIEIKGWNLQIAEPFFTQQEIDEAALEEAKKIKIGEIKFKRDIFQSIPITIGNNTYKSTRDAKLLFFSKVNGAIAADYPIKWRLVDDKTPTYLTKDEANILYEAFEEQETRGFNQESNFLTRIDDAKTLEELNAINIEYV